MVKNIIKNLLVFAFVTVLTACTGKDGAFDIRKPYSLDLTPPEGPPEYEQGWTDGCESGMNAYFNTFYKAIRVFDYHQDAKLRNNKMYYQAWKDAYLYCAIYGEGLNNLKL